MHWGRYSSQRRMAGGVLLIILQTHQPFSQEIILNRKKLKWLVQRGWENQQIVSGLHIKRRSTMQQQKKWPRIRIQDIHFLKYKKHTSWDPVHCNNPEHECWHQANLPFTDFVEANYFTSLGLSFPIWEMGIITVSNSWD